MRIDARYECRASEFREPLELPTFVGGLGDCVSGSDDAVSVSLFDWEHEGCLGPVIRCLDRHSVGRGETLLGNRSWLDLLRGLDLGFAGLD